MARWGTVLWQNVADAQGQIKTKDTARKRKKTASKHTLEMRGCLEEEAGQAGFSVSAEQSCGLVCSLVFFFFFLGHSTPPQLAGQCNMFSVKWENVWYYRNNSRVYLAPKAGAHECHIPVSQSRDCLVKRAPARGLQKTHETLASHKMRHTRAWRHQSPTQGTQEARGLQTGSSWGTSWVRKETRLLQRSNTVTESYLTVLGKTKQKFKINHGHWTEKQIWSKMEMKNHKNHGKRNIELHLFKNISA